MSNTNTVQAPIQYWKFNLISPSILELHIKGTIGGPELSHSGLKTAEWNLARMRRMLFDFGKEITEIHIRINSGGGLGAEGRGIYGLLKNHSARKLVVIDYMCGSAATIVAMAGDRIFMRANGRFCVHESKSLCIGSASDFLSAGHTLAKLERETRKLYTKKTGLSDKRLESMLFHETNLTAEEALKLGFIDEILPPSEDAQKEFGNYSPNAELLDHKCLQCGFSKWNRPAEKDESKSDQNKEGDAK